MADDDKFLFSVPAKSVPEATSGDGKFMLSVPVNEKGAPVLDTSTQGLMDRAPDDSTVDTALKAVGTTVGKGLSHIPGQIGDLNDLGRFIVLGGESLIRNKPLAQVYKESDERLKDKPKTWLQQMPTGRDVYDWVNKHLGIGEYEPSSKLGQYAMAAGEAGLGGISPLGTGVAIGKNLAARPAVELAKDVLKSNAKQSLTYGTLGGGAGEAVTDTTGSPGLGVAAALGAPALTAGAVRPVAKYMEPAFAGNKEKLAAERMMETTSKPQEALDALNQPHEIVPGTKPTTAEVTGDVKQAQAQETARRNDADFEARLIEQRGQQNQARLGLLRPLASPEAEPKAVSKALEEHLQTIGDYAAAQTTSAEAAARAAGRAIPEAGNIEALGANQRAITRQYQDETRGLFKQLYDSIDPEGQLAIVADDITGAVEKIRKAGDRPMKKPSELATEMLDMASKMPRVAKLQDVIDFDQTLTAQMRKAAKADDWSGHEQLADLKRATKKAINDAVENQHKFEAAAVQRGEMPWEKTLAHNLQRAVDHWYGSKAGLDTQGQAQAVTGGGSRTVPGSAGSNRTGAVPPGIEGIPSDLTPNFDAESAQRLTLANRGYGMWKDEKRPLDAAMKRQPMGPDYVMRDDALASKIFTPGDQGYTNIQNWLTNARNDPRALANIENIATTRLREAMGTEGMLSQDKLDAWKLKYGNALRAIDEVSPGFSQRFDAVANATTAFDEAVSAQKAVQKQIEKSTFKKFIGAEGDDELRARVGEDLTKSDSGRRVTQMVETLKDSPEALEGYKKSVLDWVLDRVSNASVDSNLDNMVSAAKLPDFVYRNPTAIKALFGDEGLDYMRRVSADLERTQRMLTHQRSTVGSDTARYLTPYFQAAQNSGESLGGMMPMILWGAWSEHGWKGLGTVAVGNAVKQYIQTLRNRGIKNVNELYLAGLENPEIGRALLQRGMDGEGHINEHSIRMLLRAIQGGEAVERETTEQREGRASGGAVSDHSRAARHLVRMVEKARKQTTERTKPLLEAHDSVVAHALELAGRSI